MVAQNTSNHSSEADRLLQDLNTKNIQELNPQDYSFRSKPQAQFSLKKVEEDTSKTTAPRKPFAKALLTSLAMLTPLSLMGSEQEQASNDPSLSVNQSNSNAVRVHNFVQENWQLIESALENQRSLSEIPDINQRWNNLEAALHVSDVTGLDPIHEIRQAIIREGGHNPEVPAHVVHSALYTTAKYAEHINDRIADLQQEREQLEALVDLLDKALKHHEELNNGLVKKLKKEKQRIKNQLEQKDKEIEVEENIRESISSLVKPFLGKFIVDIKKDSFPVERMLLNETELSYLGSKYKLVQRYDKNDFDRLAAFIMGRVADKDSILSALSSLRRSSMGSESYESFLTVLEYLDSNKSLPNSAVADLMSNVYKPQSKTEAEESYPLLRVLGAELVSNSLGKLPESKSLAAEHLARTVKLMVPNNNEQAVAAAGQWFSKRSSADLANSPSTADYIMLDTLSELAKTNRAAKSRLFMLVVQHPEFVVGNTLLRGVKQDGSSRSAAAKSLSEVFNANKVQTIKLFRQLLDGKAVIPADNNKFVKVSVSGESQETARKYALQVMLASPASEQFADVFKNIVADDFSSEREQKIALQGLARAQDQSARSHMIRIGTNENLSVGLRSVALESLQRLDMPVLTDKRILDTFKTQQPFTLIELPTLVSNLEDWDRAVDSFGTTSILQTSIANRMHAWLKRHNTAREIAGSTMEISPEHQQRMLVNSYRRELGATDLSTPLSADQVKHLDSMVDYLKSCKSKYKSVDMRLAVPMIKQLGKAAHIEAQAVLLDIATYPEHYASDRVPDGPWGAYDSASRTAALKGIAIENLGGMVDLENPEDIALQTLLKVAHRDSARFYQASAQVGLELLANRFESSIKEADSDLTEKLVEQRNLVAQKTLEILQYHASAHTDLTQMRLVSLTDQFVWAKLVDKLGGSELLLAEAERLFQEDPNNIETNGPDTVRWQRPAFARAAVHALLANGKSKADIESLDISDEQEQRFGALFDFIAKEQYWLGKAKEHKFTGEKQEFALVDVGYIQNNPLTPDMNKKVIYPENIINPSDLINSRDYHPTAVAATYFAKNPNATIRTYSATGTMPHEEFRPEHTKDAFIRSLEDLAELQITGEANVDVVNYSLGFANGALHNPKLRDQLLDLIRAHMLVLSKMGVVHSTAAANSYGEYPASARYGALGEVNSLGVVVGADGEVAKQPGVFVASAQDAYTGSVLAEFSSVLDTLRADNAFNLIAYDGVHVLLPWVEDGKWVLIPINGTSFASPNQAAMLSWAKEAAHKAGVTIEHTELQELFKDCTLEMQERDTSEGAEFFHVPTFLDKLNELIAGKLN